MCEIDYDDCEPTQVWSETLVKAARKQHRCDCCDGLILPGESYVKHFSCVRYGKPLSGKICRPCDAARDEFAKAHGTIGVPQSFAYDLRECFGEEAREFWTKKDRRWRTLLAGMLLRGRAADRATAA